MPPAPMKPRTSPLTPAPARKPIATTPAEAHRMAQTLAKEAGKAPGVRKATVVVSGNTAFVGLELNKKTTNTRETDMIKNDVATRIKKMESRITTVLVASDPDTMTRLNKIATGIREGKPVSSFVTELSVIARRITPTSK
ncbi:MAG: YhcN/YlaJ family sporulation lipoprotein [Bacillota bacterium]